MEQIIGPGEKCLTPTDKCFWKDPQDIRSCGVKTRSRTKKELTVSIQDYINYFDQREWINQWILGTELKSNKFYQ